MCTAMNFNGYFGRTLDYEHGFGEEVSTLRRGSVLHYRHRGDAVTSYTVTGMARVESGYPLFFDAMNEKGVAMAGLNFVGNASYPQGSDGDVTAFEFIPFVLSQAANANEAKQLIEGIRIANTPFSESLPTASLHWMVGDKDETFVVECTKDGQKVYPNPFGVLTNDPPFPYQISHLNCFINLSPLPALNRFSPSTEITPLSRGMGAIGLPGDWSSPSRFVRAAFVRENAEREGDFAHFFAMLRTVAVPKGCMILENGDSEYTRYTSCMDLKNGVYRYTTYTDTSVREFHI